MTRKIILGFLLLISSIFLFPGKTRAEEQFQIDAFVTYTFSGDGNAHVREDITLENTFSDFYAASYTVSLQNMHPVNVGAVSGPKKLAVQQTEENGAVLLKTTLEDAPAGKGKRYSFSLNFDVEGLATRTGEVWEVSVPKVGDIKSYRSYQTRVLIPTSFGNEAYINPISTAKTKHQDFLIYDYSKNDLEQGGITAAFGEFQVFSFTLNYHLENPLNRASVTEITLPPDTAFQKMHFAVLKPAPIDVKADRDGNWIATYKLKARERLDITAQGSVQIYAKPRKINFPAQAVPQEYLGETEFWQVNDPTIRSTALRLKTARAIYDYVRQTLKYDYQRVKPNVERKGAVAALADPSSAICMEFTDLFIALARAAGIPAREINGYAYTENPELQPLSLVADVLHAWPEYWDGDKGVWIPVDPTWGSTTGGIDYFDNLDLRHFTFVIHGQSATRPFAPGSYKLGENPQKDVFVSFGQLPEKRQSIPKLFVSNVKTMPFTATKYSLTIENPGPTALYDQVTQIYFDDTKYSETKIAFLPPFSRNTQVLEIPFSLFANNLPRQIVVRTAGEKVALSTNREMIIIYNLAAIFAVLIFILLAILGRAYRGKIAVALTRLGDRIRNHVRRKNSKTPQEPGNGS